MIGGSRLTRRSNSATGSVFTTSWEKSPWVMSRGWPEPVALKIWQGGEVEVAEAPEAIRVEFDETG